MIKLLFFDYREVEAVEGFARRLEPARKHGANPLFVADRPWEHGNMQLYGSVIRPPGGRFQIWYNTIRPPFEMRLAYAESDDGLVWRRPELDLYEHEGSRTNVLMADEVHGPAVVYDQTDPDPARRYKMVAGGGPARLIMAWTSPDGIAWTSVRGPRGRGWPIIPNRPDCPMGLLRTHDGRWACFHRFNKHRRICRNESLSFDYWSDEPRLVLEPDAHDPPQVQFYGMGAWAYGDYEMGAVWNYLTEVEDFGASKMIGHQQAELAYSRGGYAWHRLAQNELFVPAGTGEAWDRGNVQCASQPVYLEDEIRFYYAGTTARHEVHWELKPQTAGLGMASVKPDRFVALEAGDAEAELLTVSRKLPALSLRVNAAVADGGAVSVAVLDAEGRAIEGLTKVDCAPITGDSTRHVVRFRDRDDGEPPPETPVRIRLRARRARVYSISALEPDEAPVYHRFESWRP